MEIALAALVIIGLLIKFGAITLGDRHDWQNLFSRQKREEERRMVEEFLRRQREQVDE